jgi:hypothetical protein
MKINRILTDADRNVLAPVIQSMWNTCPDMMARKISEANVQQAFVLNQVRLLMRYKKDATCLSVGCFEDTAFETLKREGYDVIGIDPHIDFDLHSYLNDKNRVAGYDIVFATSVIEHVKNDEEFIADMCKLLNSGGHGILTTDFKDDYRKGDAVPSERFYTRDDLEVRLRNILKLYNCDLIDEPDWTEKDSFVYQGHHYSFATFVFRKSSDV